MKKDKVDLLRDVAELAALFEEASSLEEFLDRVVALVADHMHASVCSVYLFDESEGCLVLRATKGLSRDVVGLLRLKLGEGAVATALKELRPIREGRAPESPYFKPIPGIREELYSAMLAVPIVRGVTRVGVLVVQHEQSNYFDEQDTRALRAIAVQLAATLENIRLLIELRRVQSAGSTEMQPVSQPRAIQGVTGSEGIAIGEALVIGRLADPLAGRA